MFAYCQNKPTMYEDSSGCAIKPNTTFINDGAGGTPGPIGVFSNVDYQDMQDFFDCDDELVSFSAIKESDEVSGGTKTASLLSGTVDLFGVGTDGFTLLSFDMSAVKLDLSNRARTLSLFNLGNVSASAGVGIVPYAEAVVSVWSPSISFPLGTMTCTLTGHFGSLGVGFHVNDKGFGGTFSAGVGGSISVS